MAAAISPHDATDKELLTFLAPHYADALMSRPPVRASHPCAVQHVACDATSGSSTQDHMTAVCILL